METLILYFNVSWHDGVVKYTRYNSTERQCDTITQQLVHHDIDLRRYGIIGHFDEITRRCVIVIDNYSLPVPSLLP